MKPLVIWVIYKETENACSGLHFGKGEQRVLQTLFACPMYAKVIWVTSESDGWWDRRSLELDNKMLSGWFVIGQDETCLLLMSTDFSFVEFYERFVIARSFTIQVSIVSNNNMTVEFDLLEVDIMF